MKNIIIKLLPSFDLFLVPFVYPAAWLLKCVRSAGVQRLPWCRRVLFRIGVFPIGDHYYEPQFDNRAIAARLVCDRDLPGIDWNGAEQLQLLDSFTYAEELAGLPQTKPDALDFYFGNTTFESGDAEFWYQLIRSKKPQRIFEVGSGNSTLMAIRAIRRNQAEDPGYRCKHVCIEPYEMPWLEQTSVTVMRTRIEEMSPAFFAELEENDILFIDSSHIIRPHGDVLFEYLELLPTLHKGVIVHVHDIFSPRNYLPSWVVEQVKFWNEQYLLEAFLTHNASWKILGALNYLHHHHYEQLQAVAPYLTRAREPGSFYLQKVD